MFFLRDLLLTVRHYVNNHHLTGECIWQSKWTENSPVQFHAHWQKTLQNNLWRKVWTLRILQYHLVIQYHMVASVINNLLFYSQFFCPAYWQLFSFFIIIQCLLFCYKIHCIAQIHFSTNIFSLNKLKSFKCSMH